MANQEAKQHEYMYKTTAIELLGISAAKFPQLGLTPDKEVPNPHYRSGPPSQLFLRERIEALVGTPEALALKPKPRKKADHASRFLKKYGGTEYATKDAASAMFNLNRYAKHPSCRRSNQEEIYEIKNRFIQALYEQGYCEKAYEHVLVLAAKRCWNCEGWGNSEDCYKCGGSGIYLPEKKLRFVAFHFSVDSEKFCWHQPQELIKFDVEYTEQPDDMPEVEVKPLEIPRGKLSEAKALVTWWLGAAG